MSSVQVQISEIVSKRIIEGYTDATGTSARFNRPWGTITTDGTNLYVAEYGNDRIRKIVIDNGTVTTIAGSSEGFRDNATGTSAMFDSPWGEMTTDGTNLYMSDTDNHRIRKIEQLGFPTIS